VTLAQIRSHRDQTRFGVILDYEVSYEHSLASAPNNFIVQVPSRLVTTSLRPSRSATSSGILRNKILQNVGRAYSHERSRKMWSITSGKLTYANQGLQATVILGRQFPLSMRTTFAAWASKSP
jgi:hypothetical protein